MIKSNIEKIQIKLNNAALKNQIVIRNKAINDAKDLIGSYKKALAEETNEKRQLEIECTMLKNQLNSIPNFIKKLYRKKFKKLSKGEVGEDK